MSSHFAFRRGRVFAVLALLFTAAGPAWAANCNGNPNARIDPATQTVPERTGANPTTVTLDGSKSTPNTLDAYQWTYLGSTPAGTAVTLANPGVQMPTFTAPNVGPAGAALNFRLTVTCGSRTHSTTTVVNVTDVFVNAPPTASAFISPLDANEGQTVTLDGSASSDPDGQPLTYAWTQVSGTPVVTLANASPDGSVMTFVAPNLGETTTLGFRLSVSDGFLTSTTDKSVSIVFNNDPPIAALNCPVGGVLTVPEGASVNLSSAGSHDPEGGALAYAWGQNAGLPNLGIGGTTTSTLAFTAPALGYQQLGGTSITMTVTDPLGASASKTCGLFITDVTPPVIVVPADITAEATSAAGAAVSYSATAQDAVEDLLPVPLACVPPSGSTFALDATVPVTCAASDAAGNSDSKVFHVSVVDTTAPTLDIPGDMAVEATSAAGAVGTYEATQVDLVDGTSPAICSPPSGSTFPLGDTTVTCSAADTHGNAAADRTFVFSVMDTTPPVIAPHADIEDVEATSAAGAVVTYTAPTWSDIVDGSGHATCLPASGATFALGTTTVTCNHTDAAGNAAAATGFTVEVVDTTPPVIVAHSDILGVEATGPNGAVVTYVAPLWTDAVSGSGSATCTPASETVFALGTTTVTCNAQDDAGNDAVPTTFTVRVVDTTPPVIAAHADVTATATGDSKALVNYTPPTATDIVDGTVPVSCTPASGTWFNVGTTAIHCQATDTAGNTATSTFNVIVSYAFAGFFSPVDNLPVVNTVQAGQSIPVKFSLGGYQGMAIFAAGYPKSIVMTCGASAQDAVEETGTAGASTLTFDPATGRYHYVWKTEKAWSGTCRQLQVKFADGKVQVANFFFKK